MRPAGRHRSGGTLSPFAHPLGAVGRRFGETSGPCAAARRTVLVVEGFPLLAGVTS